MFAKVLITKNPIPAFKHADTDIVDFLARNAARTLPPGCPVLDWSVAVDGRRRMEFLCPLPPSSEGKTWDIHTKVLGVFDKGAGKGTVMEMEHVLKQRESGQVYTRAWESVFFKGTGGWGGERGKRRHSAASFFHWKTGSLALTDLTYRSENERACSFNSSKTARCSVKFPFKCRICTFVQVRHSPA